MVFSSMSFLFFFLPALLAVYYMLPALLRWALPGNRTEIFRTRLRGARNIILLAFSLFFYAYGGLRFLLLMLASIIINYTGGLLASPENNKYTRKSGILTAVILGLGLLGWFKYSGFLAESINMLGTNIPIPKVTLPIGISFYTFQGLSYVIDVYRGDVSVQKNPVKVALYISLFPQLVAGPIVRYSAIEKEIDSNRENFNDFAAGAIRFVFGLSKKMLLANSLGEIADRLFSNTQGPLSVLAAWVGALAYTGQIYFDFSAYSDMAIGLGRMFGFHFLENFNYPYIAKSVTEFWRRWHISLSEWFRDYLYIPLGGNRAGMIKQIRNIIIVWILTGLWHGAAWNFVLWGAWFGALLLGEKFIWGKLLDKAPSGLRHFYTMLLVILSWVFFRSNTAPAALQYIGMMFGSSGKLYDKQGVYYIIEYFPEILCGVIAVFPLKIRIARFLDRKRGAASDALLLWGPRILGLALLALSYLKLATGSFNPFIYFRF